MPGHSSTHFNLLAIRGTSPNGSRTAQLEQSTFRSRVKHDTSCATANLGMGIRLRASAECNSRNFTRISSMTIQSFVESHCAIEGSDIDFSEYAGKGYPRSGALMGTIKTLWNAYRMENPTLSSTSSSVHRHIHVLSKYGWNIFDCDLKQIETAHFN